MDISKYETYVGDIKNSRNDLQTKFPDYNYYPNGAKNALLDLEYNMGINFQEYSRYKGKVKLSDGWPRLFNAVRTENWNEAAKQSERNLNSNKESNKTNPRNVFVKEQFKKAENEN